jgi:hypothetical protein
LRGAIRNKVKIGHWGQFKKDFQPEGNGAHIKQRGETEREREIHSQFQDSEYTSTCQQ